MGSIVALAGQIGGAKLADGLYRLRGERLTVIVNSGDDYELFGLPLAPDALLVLAKELRTACGSGGTVKEGVVEVQGDQRDKVLAFLARRGFLPGTGAPGLSDRP